MLESESENILLSLLKDYLGGFCGVSSSDSSITRGDGICICYLEFCFFFAVKLRLTFLGKKVLVTFAYI